MSKFLGHIPCPKCGSKDNLGEYDDHLWCFGCKYHIRKTDTASLRARVNRNDSHSQLEKESVRMLENISELPQKAMKWLLSYGISQEEIDKYGIQWNVKDEMLVLLQTAKYWQSRTFDSKRPKYMSLGSKPLTIYGTGDTIVIVEDIITAMKIARLREEYCACPLLGSSLSYDMENQLVEKFSNSAVWLDRDKAKNALRISRKLKQRGLDSRVIVTEDDPKEYSKEVIRKFLKKKNDK
jgi:Zn ribbon nucleic-acid-binding protein